MTNDQKSPEKEDVFLGPTTAEIDEFNAYQRESPGKEKAEYHQWFEGKFGNVEYVVTKKRSKYQKRIVIENVGREIDTTSALKRSRASEACGDSPPDLNSGGPSSAKRGRRSYDSAGPMSSSASGSPPSSMPIFSVDISNNRPQPDSDMNTSGNQSRQMTPQVHIDLDELKGSLFEAVQKQTQFTAQLLRQHEMDVLIFMAMEQGFLAERERLVQEIMSLKAWIIYLQSRYLIFMGIEQGFVAETERLVQEIRSLKAWILYLQSRHLELRYFKGRLEAERFQAIQALERQDAEIYTITEALKDWVRFCEGL